MSPGLTDEAAMRLALAEARRGIGLTNPNPPVGAVVARGDAVLGVGFTAPAGGPHAEVRALRAAVEAGHDPRGATIYVTLEPCSTHGRTPPCVDALIAAGLARVVWGTRDPNPAHEGRAVEILQKAGLSVTTGVCETECAEILAPFAKCITTGLPWVTVKAGISLDGRITRPEGEGQWLTGSAARADAMRLRAGADAIFVGAETVRMDDPSLTVRGIALPEGKLPPLRVVFTRSGELPAGAKLFTDELRERTRVVRNQNLEDTLRHFVTTESVMSVLFEGGGQVHAEAFREGLVDEVIFYLAPLISGSGRPVVDPTVFSGGSVPLRLVESTVIGPDVKLRYLVDKPGKGACP